MSSPEPEKGICKPEIVNLGEEFILFDPTRTHIKRPFHIEHPELTKFITNAAYDHDQFTLQIQLQIPSMPPIPIDIEAKIFPKTHHHFGVNPFDHKAKETITAEDFDLEKRIKKWKEAWQKDKDREKRGESGIRPESPLELVLRASMYTLHDIGLTDEVKRPIGQNSPLTGVTDYVVNDVIKPKFLKYLEEIYLSLTFPFGTWVSEGKDVRKEGLGFYYFHPSETAPLACDPNGSWNEGGALDKGVPLFVPSELNRLSQIKGKFQRLITG